LIDGPSEPDYVNAYLFKNLFMCFNFIDVVGPVAVVWSLDVADGVTESEDEETKLFINCWQIFGIDCDAEGEVDHGEKTYPHHEVNGEGLHPYYGLSNHSYQKSELVKNSNKVKYLDEAKENK